MYIVWTGQVHCSLQLFLAKLMWYLVLVFRSYSCFVTIFWSICFSSSQVFASILRWVCHINFRSFFVFSVAFFSGCFPQHCIDIVLFLHCSYSLEIWFAHITVLSSILCHFGNLCYFPKDPGLFTVSYFPLVLSVLRCLNANSVLDMTAYF